MAECMNVSESTVQRRIRQMERDGLINRIKRYNPKTRGQQTNAYDFAGLIRSATPYAEEAIQEREEKKNEAVARRRRKGVLRAVPNDD
jgi:DNA-binding Lrp family transcriptional regulator